MICTPHSILFGCKIEKNEMGGAYSTYWGGKRRIQCFVGGNLREQVTWNILV